MRRAGASPNAIPTNTVTPAAIASAARSRARPRTGENSTRLQAPSATPNTPLRPRRAPRFPSASRCGCILSRHPRRRADRNFVRSCLLARANRRFATLAHAAINSTQRHRLPPVGISCRPQYPPSAPALQTRDEFPIRCWSWDAPRQAVSPDRQTRGQPAACSSPLFSRGARTPSEWRTGIGRFTAQQLRTRRKPHVRLQPGEFAVGRHHARDAERRIAQPRLLPAPLPDRPQNASRHRSELAIRIRANSLELIAGAAPAHRKAIRRDERRVDRRPCLWRLQRASSEHIDTTRGSVRICPVAHSLPRSPPATRPLWSICGR